MPIKEDKLVFTILDDGTIRTETEGISGANHSSADAFVKGVDALLAGKVSIEKRKRHRHHHESAKVHKTQT